MITVIAAENYLTLSRLAANFIIDKIKDKPELVIGLATGSTPIGTYKELIKAYEKNNVSFKRVTSVNLDEYIGLTPAHPNSYHSFMKEKLFNKINLPVNQRFIPSGLSGNVKQECARYEELIKTLGGIDLQILGIGRNGHIGFNEPGTSFDTRTHLVELTPSTQEANARFFDARAEVPKQAITMGIQTIMESREILLLASGRKKAEAVSRLLSSKKADEDFPASVLNRHDKVTLIADNEALSIVNVEKETDL